MDSVWRVTDGVEEKEMERKSGKQEKSMKSKEKTARKIMKKSFWISVFCSCTLIAQHRNV